MKGTLLFISLFFLKVSWNVLNYICRVHITFSVSHFLLGQNMFSLCTEVPTAHVIAQNYPLNSKDNIIYHSYQFDMSRVFQEHHFWAYRIFLYVETTPQADLWKFSLFLLMIILLLFIWGGGRYLVLMKNI